jgi:serine phosphatase RsbU (regulator of sigma subunit)/pSer/pThr/pTyr-binding forkhead associated (FHA) protein
MPYLKIVRPGGTTESIELEKEVVRAGRSPANDVRLDDPAASREHFEVRRRDGRWVIRDLGSRNGTVLNGVEIDSDTALEPGDEVQVGHLRLLFEDRPSAFRTTAPSQDSGTVMFEAEQLSRAFLAEVESRSDQRSRRQVFLLSEVAKEFMSITDEEALLERLAGKMLGVFRCDRCAVIYDAESDDEAIEVKALACSTSDLAKQVTISTTAARHVLDEKMALVITDVLADDRFSAQQSILDGQITSILCAPLWHGDSVFGLLYLDTTGRIGIFEKEQLALLSAFANLAAIKIDNLRLVAQAIATARMERELSLAAEIQAKMLPPPGFSVAGFDCVGYNRACFEVGGDYYDFIPLDEQIFTVTVADVSGKGASGAMLMASCKSMLTALVDSGVEMLERVTKLNRFVRDNSTANKFITFFHAEINTTDGTLRYCNAGHNPPILVSPGGATDQLQPTGPVLGLLDLPYGVEERPFESGSVLVAFSDGVTEAANIDDEEYEQQRLVDLVAELSEHSPEACLDAILDDVHRFTGDLPQQDDVTLVIVKRMG